MAIELDLANSKSTTDLPQIQQNSMSVETQKLNEVLKN